MRSLDRRHRGSGALASGYRRRAGQRQTAWDLAAIRMDSARRIVTLVAMATKPAPAKLAQEPARVANGQAERSAATRAKLIRATIATLNTLGYTATTTIEVVRRARVSRGAMLHHFSTRAELLLGTAEH